MELKNCIQRTALVAITALTLTPAIVSAADTPKPKHESGIIKSVDQDSHTMVVADHKTKAEAKFQWNGGTKFTENHKTSGAGALKAGEHVNLTYQPGGDPHLLQSVQISRV